MPEATFINYVNGDHRNDIEQQRKISAHASEQKQARRRAACRRKRNPDAATDALEAHDLCMRKPKGRPPSLDILHSSSIVAQLGLYRKARSNASIKSIEFDPYSNFSSMDVPEHRRIVDYVLRHYAQSIQPLQRALGYVQDSTRKNFAMALMSPELFYAIMAMGSASYEMKQYKIIPDRPSHRVLHFKGLALRTLSAKLQKDYDEISYQDAQPVMIHRRALRKLIACPPGPGTPDCSSWLLHEKLALFRTNYLSEEEPAWCLGRNETLLSPFPAYRRQPLRYPNPFELTTTLQEIPEGFRSIALLGGLSVEVLEIIKRMYMFTKILDKAHTRAQPVSESESAYVVAYRAENEFHNCIDCLRRISPYERPVKSSSIDSHSTLVEHVVCLALLIFCNCEFGCMIHGPLFKAVQESLLVAVEGCAVRLGQEDCIIWARSVGLWAASITTGQHSQSAEAIIRGLREGYGKHLCVEEYRDVLRRFLWTEDMMLACEQSFKRPSDLPCMGTLETPSTG
ncbi:hypothetical protein LTR99_002365 [Exophiala xenobiotica]|uniref:Uncharacterized protein n=1 Tax=Vermiconidia calcicola TaxID=1690605 RepID=A0AAV9QIH5_9PEZI|nr:hypothetical protein LTR92_004781 [Exophiala xenobiotica]KAK5272971.1 hypothetical protein LTR96_002603 [Exophiala xenobiotica]KAK5306673.1 hypothetical protein LTR99_002365 [Exophiala xenobiotica]KAK5434065.1 hypothetical protein LTR34_003577 [Exophiala xenobiotica]KAK5542297.1 hypothetical protein LTR25_002182 [Vermiconidia calcicola]